MFGVPVGNIDFMDTTAETVLVCGAGVTNEFLMNTNAETALVYNDNSINENMHASVAWRLLQQPQNNFLGHLLEEEQRFVRRTLIQIILATDMAGHSTLLKV